ncbi:MAG: hypothetical protein A3F09_05785 [Chlamydiae bacterium RIFCSPHIGHO2_12_FULL_49_11]|nr:MAG: hypothetical protein A3F09_05785 [Chlamydiae bacterium RIFCSPHIGHO2_12_FULL_49_11]
MYFSHFFQGILLGLGLILPLGPQNLFVLSQGMNRGRMVNVITVVLVASLADTVLIALAVGGISLVIFNIPLLKAGIFLGGILFLSFLAIRSWYKMPNEQSFEEPKTLPILRIVGSTLAISWLNPYALIDAFLTIGSSSTIFSGLPKVFFMTGCITASWIWFMCLGFLGISLGNSLLIRKYQGKVSAIIMVLSIAVLIRAFFHSQQ